MVSVVSYGVGNLGSIINMLERVGAGARLVSDAESLEEAERLLLPGVGAFDSGMQKLNESGLVPTLRALVLERRVPILGICLGMQMLGCASGEGEIPGLGFIEAHSHRFHFDAPGMKVPHMGWNHIRPRRESRLLRGLDADSRFYFVHSYYMKCASDDDVLATTEYGHEFASLVEHGNIFGAQFHPEKSHRFGMTLLRNFASI